MNSIGKGTMISIGTVIATIIPATMAWSRLEAKVFELENHKANKLEVAQQLSDIKLDLQEIKGLQNQMSRDVKRILKEKE